jgi:peptide deformylase
MIYPIIAFGDPVLRKKAGEISRDYPELNKLIESMFDTMYHSLGVGLAAPQIGLPIRLFVIDGSPFKEDDPGAEGFKKVFINAKMMDETGDLWKFNEGCLSIPGIREDVQLKEQIRVKYFD